MTRVNLVDVSDLADQHLFAEWREIKMVPAALLRSLKTKSPQQVLDSIPDKYTLNTGHVLFFMNKMKYLYLRYLALTYELNNRNYDISYQNAEYTFFDRVPQEFSQVDWEPTKPEVAINIERILLRISERPNWYRYYSKVMQYDYFDNLYTIYT